MSVEGDDIVLNTTCSAKMSVTINFFLNNLSEIHLFVPSLYMSSKITCCAHFASTNIPQRYKIPCGQSENIDAPIHALYSTHLIY